ncbi:hypothetical protein TcYC6_0062790 [Trypanosoma cruzi]|nr:hypothetical protein TcYC6_0062790 [Trypanosoma cruzi]
MAMIPYTATEWSFNGGRILDLVRHYGDIQAQLACMDEHRPLDVVVTVAATMALRRWISGDIAKHWGGFNPCGALCEPPGASSTNFRDPIAPAVCRGRSESQCAALLAGRRGA